MGEFGWWFSKGYVWYVIWLHSKVIKTNGGMGLGHGAKPHKFSSGSLINVFGIHHISFKAR